MRRVTAALALLAGRASASSGIAALPITASMRPDPAAACSVHLTSRCNHSTAIAPDAQPPSSNRGAVPDPQPPRPQQQQQQQQQAAATGGRPVPHAGGTVSQQEAAKFAALAADWWDPRGPFAPLHAMNPVRCRFLRHALCSAFGRDASQARPLSGLRLLDVGCGGGLLAESLARMGAYVTGIDVNEGGIATAVAHAELDPDLAGRLQYRTAAAEQLIAERESFDAVIASEVIEHVASLPAFCSALAALTRPGGGVAISTLNRTPRSYLAAVLLAEHVLRWVPPGTHDWDRFITPEELVMQMEESTGSSSGGGSGEREGGSGAGGKQEGSPPLQLQLLAGMEYNPLTRQWSLGRDTGINYIAWFAKQAVA